MQTVASGGLLGRAQTPAPPPRARGRALTPAAPAPEPQGRLVSTITREELESCFHMPSEQACRHLG